MLLYLRIIKHLEHIIAPTLRTKQVAWVMTSSLRPSTRTLSLRLSLTKPSRIVLLPNNTMASYGFQVRAFRFVALRSLSFNIPFH